LKWAGGKRQLLPQLRRYIPETFSTYFEPFVGSGALFFDLANNRSVHEYRAVLTDINRDLVGCYRAIATDVEAVISELGNHAGRHSRRQQAYYYEIRDDLFNPTRRELFNRSGPEEIEYPACLAAMFIYLNRTGFNGLYRLNSRGDFNVPAGRYANPQICDADNLRAVSRILASDGVEVRCRAFDVVLEDARRGDLVYFDPPYAPMSATSSFTSYTADGFSSQDQEQLREVAIELADRGCHVIVSNSTAPLITSLYRNSAVKRAGLRAHRVAARRAINCDATRRGDISEYILTNVPASN
jgi:DNA adenine methylase